MGPIPILIPGIFTHNVPIIGIRIGTIPILDTKPYTDTNTGLVTIYTDTDTDTSMDTDTGISTGIIFIPILGISGILSYSI